MILQLVDIIAPVFLLISAGYAVVRLGWFDAGAVDGLMSFALKFAAPALLFRSVLKLDLSASFDWRLLVTYFTGATLSFFLGVFLARTLFNRRPGESVAVGFAALFSNGLLLGFPITERAFGADALVGNIAIISVHAPYCYLLGISMMETSRRDGSGIRAAAKRIIVAMFRNPLMIGIGLGFVVNIGAIPLWAPIMSSVDMLARVTLPAALFGLGGVLTRYSFTSSLPETASISVLALVVHPMIVYGLGVWVFALPQDFLRSAVLTASMAPGVNAFVFASMYDRAKGAAASIILLATMASVVTVSVWLWVLG